MTAVFINPGAGRIGAGTVTRARENIRAFVKDLGYDKPRVEIIGDGDLEDDGRYAFGLKRGVRETTVSMPAYPLDKVRILHNDNQNPWHFPRLYVDGSSWLWCFAVDQARDALWDPYKVVELARDASQKANEKAMKKTGWRCPACKSVLENQGVPHPEARYEYSHYKIVCLGCTPEYTIVRRDYRYENSVRVDWQGRDHWAITYQIMPREVIGSDHLIDPDTGDPHVEAFCSDGYWRNDGNGQCIRRHGHDGPHAYRRKVIHEVLIRSYDAIPSPKHPSSCPCDGCRWYRAPRS